MEYFSGVGTIHTAFSKNGLSAQGFDIIRNAQYESISTATGFLTALNLVRRMRTALAMAHFATVCSSWVWLSRGSTKRSNINVLGCSSSASAQEGNLQVSRMVLLMMFIAAKRCKWVLEQPATSLMDRHPDMKVVAPWTEIRTWMGMFGATVKKPTKLFANTEMILQLHRRLDPTRASEWNAGEAITRRTANGRVQGTRALKDRRARKMNQTCEKH